MHSSRMRTVHCSSRLSCHAHPPSHTRPLLCTPPPCTLPAVHAPPAMYATHGPPPRMFPHHVRPPPDRMTDACENNLSATTVADGNKEVSEITDVCFYSSVLSDAKKKARYDSGQDLEDLEGGFGGKSHFQSLFC